MARLAAAPGIGVGIVLILLLGGLAAIVWWITVTSVSPSTTIVTTGKPTSSIATTNNSTSPVAVPNDGEWSGNGVSIGGGVEDNVMGMWHDSLMIGTQGRPVMRVGGALAFEAGQWTGGGALAIVIHVGNGTRVVRATDLGWERFATPRWLSPTTLGIQAWRGVDNVQSVPAATALLVITTDGVLVKTLTMDMGTWWTASANASGWWVAHSTPSTTQCVSPTLSPFWTTGCLPAGAAPTMVGLVEQRAIMVSMNGGAGVVDLAIVLPSDERTRPPIRARRHWFLPKFVQGECTVPSEVSMAATKERVWLAATTCMRSNNTSTAVAFSAKTCEPVARCAATATQGRCTPNVHALGTACVWVEMATPHVALASTMDGGLSFTDTIIGPGVAVALAATSRWVLVMSKRGTDLWAALVDSTNLAVMGQRLIARKVEGPVATAPIDGTTFAIAFSIVNATGPVAPNTIDRLPRTMLHLREVGVSSFFGPSSPLTNALRQRQRRGLPSRALGVSEL